MLLERKGRRGGGEGEREDNVKSSIKRKNKIPFERMKREKEKKKRQKKNFFILSFFFAVFDRYECCQMEFLMKQHKALCFFTEANKLDYFVVGGTVRRWMESGEM